MESSFVETEFESTVPIKGSCHKDFQKVAEAVAQNFTKYREIGAAVCVVVDGETTVDLWAGYKTEQRIDEWDRNTLSVAFSSTKAALALCAHLLIDRGELNPKEKVVKY